MIMPPDDPADLELPAEVMRAMGQAVLAQVVDHIASLPDQPACGDVAAEELCRAMREPAPEHGAPLDELLDPLVSRMDPALVQHGRSRLPGLHPRRRHLPGRAGRSDRRRDQPLHRRLAGRPGPGSARGQRARLVSRLDGLSAHHPRPVHHRRLDVDLQRHRLRPRAAARDRDPLGRPLHIDPGPRLGRQIGQAGRHPARSGANGLGRRAVPHASRRTWRSAIDADRRAGLRPFLVVSTAGTTNTGAVDPLEAIADLCARAGLWHHVDGAYGAFFHLVEPLRPLLAGLPRADSLTLDPHKGLFLPYGTGALLVRDGSALRAVHGVPAGYLPPAADLEFYDPAQHGPELSRGFPGLRVWLTIKTFGAAQLRAAIAEKRALAVAAAERLARRARDRTGCPAAALALRLPPRAARHFAGRARRRDPAVARAGQRPRPSDADRLHGGRAIPGPRLRAELPHAPRHVETAMEQIIEEATRIVTESIGLTGH